MNFPHTFQYGASSSTTINSTLKSPTTSSENIRERLNLHVKRRIQVQEKKPTLPQLIAIHSPSSSCSSLSPPSAPVTIKQEQISPQNLSFATSSAIVVLESRKTPRTTTAAAAAAAAASATVRTNAANNVRIKYTKKPTKKQLSKLSPPVDNAIQYLQTQQMIRTTNGNRINGEINHDIDMTNQRRLIEINTMPGAGESLHAAHRGAVTESPVPHSPDATMSHERSERLTSSVDILQMVLNEKKNAMLHDPEIQKFLAAIHKNLFSNRNKR